MSADGDDQVRSEEPAQYGTEGAPDAETLIIEAVALIDVVASLLIERSTVADKGGHMAATLLVAKDMLGKAALAL